MADQYDDYEDNSDMDTYEPEEIDVQDLDEEYEEDYT